MTLDDLLMAVVVIGLVVSSGYIVAECLFWRSRRVAETNHAQMRCNYAAIVSGRSLSYSFFTTA
jgi:hypothetical protein